MVEELPLMDPYKRVTRRIASYILELCRYMMIKEVAEHLALDWKTVTAIHKRHLQEKFSGKSTVSPKILLVDEIAIRKGHTSLTLIVDREQGRILWGEEDRKYETLKEFFYSLTEEQKGSIWAIAMDMEDPYNKAVKECCPQARIDEFDNSLGTYIIFGISYNSHKHANIIIFSIIQTRESTFQS
jgi:transposase